MSRSRTERRQRLFMLGTTFFMLRATAAAASCRGTFSHWSYGMGASSSSLSIARRGGGDAMAAFIPPSSSSSLPGSRRRRWRSSSTRVMQQHEEGAGGVGAGASSLPPLNGFIAVNKPEGWTSNDVVNKVRNMVEKSVRQIVGQRVKVKVGHGGTLDPMATGVLVLGVGSGCKDMQAYLKGSKAYRAVAMLGTEYDTLDRMGTAIETVDVSHVTVAMLDKALQGFRGEIMQRPPAFSAIKKGGKRLYDLARQGEMVEAEPRPVVVEKLELVAGHDLPEFGLDVVCQGGTYVRSLISDIAKAVDARAHMTALVRTQQGPFHLHHCLDSEHWSDFDRLVRQLESCTAIAREAEAAKEP